MSIEDVHTLRQQATLKPTKVATQEIQISDFGSSGSDDWTGYK